jgi:RecA-family ATPase
VSGLESNLIPFAGQPIAVQDLSALIAEGMTPAEIAWFIDLANADVRTQSRLINDNTKEPEAARRFTYRLMLVRRALAQIDWSKAVVRDDAKAPKVILVSAADIEPEPVEWLWRDWLQCGAFNLIAGKPGVAKSTIALSFCATVTSGGMWPDGHAFGEPWRAVYWSGEDGVRDTLLPRFLAAGGERTNMRVQGISDNGKKRPFDPSRDMLALEDAVTALKDVRLVVIDPIAVMIRGDSHKNVETRVGLQPFADLFAKIGACGLGVHHLTKNTAGGDPLDRISGSLACGALARCVLVATRDINADGPPVRTRARAKARKRVIAPSSAWWRSRRRASPPRRRSLSR